MGARIGKLDAKDDVATDFINFLNTRKRNMENSIDRTEKTTFNSEIKWKQKLTQILSQFQDNKRFKDLAKQLQQIVKSIQRQHFIKAISILSEINNAEINQLSTKSILKQNLNPKSLVRFSNNVFVDMKAKFKTKLFPRKEQEIVQVAPNKLTKQQENQQIINKRKKISQIISREFNQPYHPFKIIKQSFMTIIRMKYRQRLNTVKVTPDIKERIYTQINKDIEFYCEFIAQGSTIYKKWILAAGSLDDSKFIKFMKKNLLNSLFSGSTTMHEIIFEIIMQVNQLYFEEVLPKMKENVSVKNFEIKQELQIEGCYVHSMMLLAEINEKTQPKQILEHLENIKHEICSDIDYYHRLFETGKNYTIDGDNLLGILCFQICKLKHKFKQIYSQIILLTVVYGDRANLDFGAGSYMVTALTAAIEHIQDPDFGKQRV